MKILIVSPKLVVGGEERDLIDLIKNLDSSKYSISICVFENIGGLISELPENVKIFDLHKKSKWDFLFLTWRLSRVIKTVKPDIVLSSLFYSTAVAAAAKSFTGHKFNIIAREPHNHIQDCPEMNLKDFVRRLLLKFGHKRADCVIAVSKGAAEDIAKNYGLPSQRVTFIHSSVDTVKIRNMAGNAGDRVKNRIITLGRLVQRKGFDSLIRSFERVKSEIKDAELLIIGEGIERENLEKLAKKMGVAESVKITGFLENPYAQIASSGVFVCSSLWEGFGKVITEAMACGTPVVSTRCNFGPEEIITDGLDGLLVPVGDDYLMAQAIIKLLKDESLSHKLSKGGIKRCEDFSLEKNIYEHEKIFHKISSPTCQ